MSTTKVGSLNSPSVDEGESLNLTGILHDATEAALVKASITAFTLTLINKADGSVINSRDNQDALDQGAGSLVDVDGKVNYTIKLDADDNVVVGDGESEAHVVTLTWTFSDGTTRTGKQHIEFTVCKDLKA